MRDAARPGLGKKMSAEKIANLVDATLKTNASGCPSEWHNSNVSATSAVI